jgi:hypothetical protein
MAWTYFDANGKAIIRDGMAWDDEPIRVWSEDEFTLRLWDTGRTDSYGKTVLRYQFALGDETIFEGDDFCPGLGMVIDSDEVVGGLLGFLSLRPGDTDSEYFAGYSDRQRWFADTHGEYLSLLAMELEEGVRNDG